MQENVVLEKFQRVLIENYTFAIFSYFKIITKELVGDGITMVPRNFHKCVKIRFQEKKAVKISLLKSFKFCLSLFKFYTLLVRSAYNKIDFENGTTFISFK